MTRDGFFNRNWGRFQASASSKGIGGRPRGEPTTGVQLPLPVATLARRLREGTLPAGDINRFLDVRVGRGRPSASLRGPLPAVFRRRRTTISTTRPARLQRAIDPQSGGDFAVVWQVTA
jgi:hypothetical protein